jgi:hypothetical protein
MILYHPIEGDIFAKRIPSDFVRTEYIEYGRGFKREVEKYLRTFFEQARYYDSVVDPCQESRNPIATIDWLRRSYLITGDEATKKRRLLSRICG